MGVSGFNALHALSTRNDDPQAASRPFDKDRDGFVLAEGSGIVVLEELAMARARGAHIYAEFLGFGSSCDAYHITAPDETAEGPARAMLMAVEDAGVRLEDIGYIPRAAFLMDAQMHRIGQHGKANNPFEQAYGCTVPAILGTRIMENSRDRTITAVLVNFIPCAARTTSRSRTP
jgi:hypothetical protein